MTQEEFIELCANGTSDLVEEAIESGVDPSKPAVVNGMSITPMFAAASSERYNIIRVLMQHHVDYADGFIGAIISGNDYVVHFIVDRLGGDIDARDRNGMTALLTAVTANSFESVENVIHLGADVNIRSKEGYNAMTYAAIMTASKNFPDTDPRIVKLLMEREADYHEAMILAIKSGSKDFIHMLEIFDADMDMRDKESSSFLMYSVMTGGEMTNTLLVHGANPDIPDNNGRTPLMIAAIDEELEEGVIDDLLEFGADINAADNKGLTALMWAVAGVNKAPDIMLPALIRTGGLRAEGWEKLLAFIALYNAAKHEMQIDIVRHLVNKGADVNIIDKRGMNALMYALMNGDDESADILAEAGAKINFEMI